MHAFNVSHCVFGPIQNLLILTNSGYWHHCLLVLVGDAEAPGQGELGHHGEGGVLLAARRVSIVLLLVADGAAALPRVVLRGDAEVVAAALVGEAGVAGRVGPLAVHGEGAEVHLVVEQRLGVVAVGELHHHHLLVHGVQVVQPPVHHRDGRGLVNGGTLL